MSATPPARPPAFDSQQVMFDQLALGQRPLLNVLTPEAQQWYNNAPPGDVNALRPKFIETDDLYRAVMVVLNDTHARQRTSLQIIDRIREALRRTPAGSNRAHQLETLLRYLMGSMQGQDYQQVNRELTDIDRGLQAPRGAGERKDIGGRGGGRKSKTRKAAKRGKKRKGGYKFTRAANSRRSLRMKTRKLKSLTQKSPKKKQKRKHGKKHGKKHDKKSKSRKARQGKHHKRGKRR